ncbi:MAG: VOC family protein [Ignavibacteriae bacterium]|nr:VOC family protein [Ignavibacteriota bacterium]
MKNYINWFEIPVADFERAKLFYETIFGFKLEAMEMMGTNMAFFPAEPGAASGSLCKGENYKPSMDGTLVYLNGNPDLSAVLNKVEGAGGKVILPKTQITPEIGHMAMFIDCEGNKIALHSNG